jgi:hypothetical protein
VSRCRLLAVGIAVGVAALPIASAEAAARKAKPFGTRSLAPGMRGHDVRVLQDFLTRVGVSTPVDGRYGPYTAQRVRTWERRAQRRVDGRVARPDARVLRSQVESGQRVASPRPAAAPLAAAEAATLGPDGRAIAPESAPPEVKATVEAANRIVGKPYKYGGGHGRWEDSGYDCSIWEKPGKGMWITTYGNSGHSFMVVAGLRFDTGYNNAGKGPRWSEEMRPTGGYSVRHPAGF